MAQLKSGGKAFAVPMLNNYHAYISNPQDIMELSNAPVQDFSFNSATYDVSTGIADLSILIKGLTSLIV